MGYTMLKSSAGGLASGVAVSVMRRGKIKQFVLRLGVDAMNLLGVKFGDLLTAELGDGKDMGQLKLMPSTLSGLKIGLSGKDARAGLIRIPPLTTREVHPITGCSYRFHAGALYVTLPDWARSKPAKAA